MFATFPRTRNQRRGVVLILVLGMLGLLALIGVTFATFSGQVKINSRNFSQAQNWPDSSELMDYALAQLIDDTDNPQSAIRGHSLKRDMYGRDAIFNSALAGHPTTGADLKITAVPNLVLATDDVTAVYDPFSDTNVSVIGLYRCVTNIPKNDGAFYGYNFTRWVLKFPGQELVPATTPPTWAVGQTHEILADDPSNDTSDYRTFYIAAWDSVHPTPAFGSLPPTLHSPYLEAPSAMPPNPMTNGRLDLFSLAPTIPYPQHSAVVPGTGESFPTPEYDSDEGFSRSTLIGMPVDVRFVLDGRFLHAFNGPGVSGIDGNLSTLNASYPHLTNRGMAQYANPRFNGNILKGNFNSNPYITNAAYANYSDVGGMDEDYDACDLENWFLALQSADGQVMIPSFHRPGILINDSTVRDPITNQFPYDDWTSRNVFSASKILRPRAAEGHNSLAFPNLYPNANGLITYDVDNDGDGTTDSVWLDLGYPARRNTDGRLYKPLYAFMIVGLNGRIPLNTAGNLQLRDLAGLPLAMHASGKGYSPSEIDPSYALQNAYATGYSQYDNAGVTAVQDKPVPIWLTQLRNLLAGTRLPDKNVKNHDNNWILVNNAPFYVPNGVGDIADTFPTGGMVTTDTTAIPGRFGEADQMPVALNPVTTATTLGDVHIYPNAIRAGISGRVPGPTASPLGYADGRDDNKNTFDFYPENPSTTAPLMPDGVTVISTLGESKDYYDASGSHSLPVERFRRFITPIDVNGDGVVNSLAAPFPAGTALAMPQLLGSDELGRVTYFKHFRPPGLALATYPGLNLPNPLTAPPGPGTVPARIYYPTAFSNLIPSPVFTGSTQPLPVYPDRTSNLYHGYEAYRVPTIPLNAFLTSPLTITPAAGSVLLGGMLTSEPNDGAPTMDQFTNSQNSATLQSANLNEADEMQVYQATPYDKAYGPSDLEWLYRQQDTDGPSLASRLSDLAPVSFKNPLDNHVRRRLFSLESWEPTNFVWANDTPMNDPQFAASTTAAVNNSSFSSSQSASLSTADYNVNVARVAAGLTPLPPTALPSVAHRDRKINLNFPLPVSNRYDEPVRQKWIRETYQLLKMILPPKAVDTPEELAQLSQYVINLVDFRDADGTATRFVNTDVHYATLALADRPATLKRSDDPTATITLGGNLAGLTPPPPPYSPLYDQSNSPYLIQYGMEYTPVAINEVLAYVAAYKNGGATADQARMWVELVNNLTQPADSLSGTTNRACHLDLQGWDFVIMPDDPTGRPDPYTGQLPYQNVTNVKPVSVNKTTGALPVTSTPPPTPSTLAANPGGLVQPGVGGGAATLNPIPVPSTADPTPNVDYFVVGKDLSTSTSEASAPTVEGEVDLVANSHLSTVAAASPTSAYYWVYLRRPANPFDTSYDSTRPNENRVVVDSFRFSLEVAPWIGDSSGSDTMAPRIAGGSATVVDGTIYSTQRLQPYRGGHAVPPIQPTGAPAPPVNYCIPAYGFSEQVYPALAGGSFEGRYGTVSSTGKIWHTLGSVNNPTDRPGWEHFAFHDRDFTSVAEMLQVPGCPPGLFTKSFVEFVPGQVVPTPPNTVPPLGPLAEPVAPAWPWTTGTIPWPPPKADLKFVAGTAPKTFPYLVDEFFYTAQSKEPEKYMNGAAIAPAAGVSWPDPGTGPAPIHPDVNFPVPVAGMSNPTFPIVTPNLDAAGEYYDGGPNYPHYIGGPSGAGWYKMLEFFDVPSPANGTTEPVTRGVNYDWARQDLKPGLLNVNLIVDEEVFFSIMSESWLKTLNFSHRDVSAPVGFYSPSQAEVDEMGATRLNVEQLANDNMTPRVVSEVLINGSPSTNGLHNMANRGFWAIDPYASNLSTATGVVWNNKMKAAFSDFLKLRHGGSGYMFAHQSGQVGDPTVNPTVVPIVGTTQIASERPFHSLSYPDINYTLLRPAALPPTSSTVLQPYLPSFALWRDNAPSAAPGVPALPAGYTVSPFKTFIGDPGLKNPYFFTQNNPPLPPPIPARRLFELPDVFGNLNVDYDPPNTPVLYYPVGFPASLPTSTPARPVGVLPSNASSAVSTYPQTWWAGVTAPWVSFTGDPNTNWENLGPVSYATGTAVPILAKRNVSIAASPTLIPQATPPSPPYIFVPNFELGANTRTGAGGVTDNRQHPKFRYDWLHKVTNLTTVRTHQYAVWITVGFFEVTKQGDPTVGNRASDLAFDRLGQEIDIQSGKNIRYRSFFIIDRTRAVGFSPQAPGNFRDCVTYRQTIE